jgi:hypothetical protein
MNQEERTCTATPRWCRDAAHRWSRGAGRRRTGPTVVKGHALHANRCPKSPLTLPVCRRRDRRWRLLRWPHDHRPAGARRQPVAVARVGLHVLPRCCTASAPSIDCLSPPIRRRSRLARARGAGADLRPSGGPAAPARGRGAAGAGAWTRTIADDARVAALFHPARPRPPPGSTGRPSSGQCRAPAGHLVHPGGPSPAGAGRPRAVRRARPRLAAAAARHRRPCGRRADRRDPGRRLQNRSVTVGALRGQGPVPDEVLRAGALAHAVECCRHCCSWCTSATARCRYVPEESDLLATEAQGRTLWRAIDRAPARDWRPRASALCAWCDHQALCPSSGARPALRPQTVAGAASGPTAQSGLLFGPRRPTSGRRPGLMVPLDVRA